LSTSSLWKTVGSFRSQKAFHPIKLQVYDSSSFFTVCYLLIWRCVNNFMTS
jgi:hypothetical protein